MPENDEPLQHRTATMSPIGSLTEDVGTKVSQQLKEDFARACRGAGTDSSKALRNYMCKVVHGKTFDELVRDAEQRSRLALCLEGPIEVLLGASVEASA